MYVSLTGLRHALRLVESLTELDDPGRFADLALTGLARLVGCDSLSFTMLGPEPGQVSVTRYPHGASSQGSEAAFAAYVHEHPLVNHYRESGDAHPVMISDFLSRQEFQRLNLYGEYFRWIPVEYQIAFGLPVEGPEIIGIALNRAEKDFTEDDRDLLNVIRLPLTAALQRARQRQFADLTDLTDLGDLTDLTDREIRVLRLAALGRTNRAIAHALDISPRTVAKHLEHIYRKLDVSSRTSAVLVALADRSPGQPAPADLPVQRDTHRRAISLISLPFVTRVGSPRPDNSAMGRKSSVPGALVASFALAVLVSGCSSGLSSSVSGPVAPSSRQLPAAPAAAASSPTAASSPAPFVSSQPATSATVTLPLIVCPTTIAIAPPPAPKPQPPVVNVSASGVAVAELAVYTDNQGRMRVLGPKGWACSAQYGADGSGGVVVSPSRESVPSNWGAGWRLPAGSSVQAVIGSQTSACVGCGEAQACALFGIAAKSFKTDFGRPCPGVRPSTEATTQVSAGIMAFADPPGVVGDGNPSGGQYAANGVMTYYSGNQDGSWQETCTLAGASKPLCTTTLNSFLAAYGDRLLLIADLLVSPAPSRLEHY